MKRIPLALLALGACLLVACGESSDSWDKVKEQSGATWDALKTWSAEKADEAKATLQKKMSDLEPQLAAARIAAKKGGEKAEAELETSVENVKSALEVLKSATAGTWKDAVQGFQAALEALKQKIHELTA